MPATIDSPSFALLETLFLQKAGSRLAIRNYRFVIEADGREHPCPPMHALRAIVAVGGVEATAAALDHAAQHGIPVSFVGAGGELRASVQPAAGAAPDTALDARRSQWAMELAHSSTLRAAFAARFVAGKINNARAILLRTARRDTAAAADKAALVQASHALSHAARAAAAADSTDAVRGHEGNAARIWFGVLSRLILPSLRDAFPFPRRSRRPPLDPLNALLSFLYALLAAECQAAVHAAGMEPALGLLHDDHHGNPALALDLMEELRPVLADRLALALVNRRQIDPALHFMPSSATADGTPGIHLNEPGRKIVLAAWRDRLRSPIRHPAAAREVPWMLVAHLQATNLRRALASGRPQDYTPFAPRG